MRRRLLHSATRPCGTFGRTKKTTNCNRHKIHHKRIRPAPWSLGNTRSHAKITGKRANKIRKQRTTAYLRKKHSKEKIRTRHRTTPRKKQINKRKTRKNKQIFYLTKCISTTRATSSTFSEGHKRLSAVTFTINWSRKK